MKRQIPPLNCLLPFEATARLGSTVRAANELGRTHGAISRQIKVLEQWLDVKLFHRDCGKLSLTDEGRSYQLVIEGVLNSIRLATSNILRADCGNIVRLHAPAILLNRWLVRHIGQFYAKFPDIEIQINSYTRAHDMMRENYDLAISLAPVESPDMNVRPLMSESIFPVASAALASRVADLSSLRAQKLLHLNDHHTDWQRWFAHFGHDFHERRNLGWPQEDEAVLQAAINGHGIALARGHLIADELSSGKLHRVTSHVRKIEQAYFLVTSKYARTHPAVRVFVDWLREEADRSSALLCKHLGLGEPSRPRSQPIRRPSLPGLQISASAVRSTHSSSRPSFAMAPPKS